MGSKMRIEADKMSKSTIFAIGNEPGKPNDRGVEPKSVIRLRGDCPLVSCSMLLAEGVAGYVEA